MCAVITWHKLRNGQTHVHQIHAILLHTAGESKVAGNRELPHSWLHDTCRYPDSLLIYCWPIFC